MSSSIHPLRRIAGRVVLGLGLSVPALTAGAQGLAGSYLAAQHAAERGDIVAAADYYARALARDSSNPVLTTRAMSHHLAAGRYPQSIALANSVLSKDETQHLAVLIRAADRLKEGEPAKALAAIPETEGPFVGRVLRAWAQYDLGREEAALATLDALGESGAGGPAGGMLAAYHAALIEAALGDDADAAPAIAAAIEQGGPSAELLAVQAGILTRLGRRAEAQEAIDSVLADRGISAPELSTLSARIGDGETPEPMVTGAVAGAAEALHGVARHIARGPNWMVGVAYARLATYLMPGMTEAHMLIGTTLTRQGQHDLAIAAFEAVPGAAPEAVDAAIGRAQAMAESDRLDEAVAALRGLVARHPENVETHSALGDMLRRNERFAEAAAAYEGAVALVGDPRARHWPLFYQRGISYERSDQWPKAEADFLKALDLEPGQPLVLNYLGYSWVDMGLNLERAREMIEEAVEKRPEDGYIVDSLGWVLYRLGDFDGAVKHLGRAVELNPVDPVINDHLGDALWMVGRRVEAEFQWRRALSFDPEDERAERIGRKLDIGLDAVQQAEAEAGEPPVIGRRGSGAADGDNDGG